MSAGADDAEESVRRARRPSSSSDLELTTDGNTQQVVGIRIAGVPVPAGATITSAYLQFTTDEVSTGASSLSIRAEALDQPAATHRPQGGHRTADHHRRRSRGPHRSGRPSTRRERPSALRTSAALVQSVVGRAGWGAGNAIAFQVSGTGVRKARSFESGAAVAPLLHMEWSTG